MENPPAEVNHSPLMPPFKNGNKVGAGRRDPSFEATRRVFIRRYLTETLARDILDAQSVKALDGDNAAAKFVFDYCGAKPVEEVEVSQKQNPLFLIMQQAIDDPEKLIDQIAQIEDEQTRGDGNGLDPRIREGVHAWLQGPESRNPVREGERDIVDR